MVIFLFHIIIFFVSLQACSCIRKRKMVLVSQFSKDLKLLCLFILIVCASYTNGQFKWMRYDNFDKIQDHITSITGKNCREKSADQLQLPKEVVSQIPRYNELLSKIFYKNRTRLLHLHNMALNRAFFYSYMLQKYNESQADFNMLPGWMYMYMSAVADVNANPKMLNGSSLYFDTNCSYPNWLETLPFNHTIPLFGPSAWRWDDYRDSENYLREMTLRTVMIKDVGAGTENYTDPKYKINPWFKLYPLPDFSAAKDSITKFTYTVGIRYSNKTGQFASEEYITNTFFGPGQPGQTADDIGLPVLFTPPYMDCGKSNQWIMSTVSPVIDYMYRYSNYTHLRRPR